MRFFVLLFLLVASLPAAAARSLAVLPLDQGAKSDTHEGLGRALAGMLISDLSRVDSLELVERDRIDVLLKEIELGEGGFIDPKTAVKLGNGVGAEWVVMGSWSVVGKTFLMDSRAVDVKTGKIVAAVDANGEIDDFITVEKTLVEGLLEKLEVAVTAGARRKIIADAATEDFEAMTTYAAGLQAEFDGRYDEAKERFQAAAQRDPQFDLPVQRLAAVRARLEQLEAERVANRADDRTQRMLDALAKSPDEMKLTGRTTDDEVLGQLSVRWALLERLDRKCQAVKEMRHYLERHKGKLAPYEHPLRYNHKHWAAFDLGLYDEKPGIWQHGTVGAPNSPFRSLVDRSVSTTYVPSLVVDITDGIDRAEEIGDSLLNLTVACAGNEPAARLAALEDLLAMTRRLGLADLTTSKNSKRPLWTEIEIFVLQAMAAVEGMSARVQARVDALVELETGNSDDDYAIRSDVKKILGTAQRYTVWSNSADGQTEAEVVRLAAAAHAADATVLNLEGPACKGSVNQLAHYHETLADPGSRRRPWALVDAAQTSTALRLAGCIEGVPAELKTVPEALAWVDTLKDRRIEGAKEECEELLSELPENTKSYRTPFAGTEDLYRGIVIGIGMRVVRRGCARVR